MKIDCQIIQDLFPLYLDDVCSQASRLAVEQHLEECESCRSVLQDLQAFPNLSLTSEPHQQEAVAKRSFRKIRRRWIASLLALLMLLPLGFAGYLGYNEYHRSGICFSNLDELWTCHQFASALESGDYSKAASFLDPSAMYEECQEALAMTVSDHMPSCINVTIDGENWVVKEWFASQYGIGSDETWSYLIHNGIDGALIPEAVWLSAYPALVPGGSYRVDNTYYYRYETQWGNFMVAEQTWNHLQTLSGDDAIFGELINMYPEHMYRDLEPVFRQHAEQIVTDIQTRLASVKGMNKEEYRDHVRKQYAKQLEMLADQDVRFESVDYQDAQDCGCWIVSYRLQAVNGSQTATFYLDLNMTEAGIGSVHFHYAGAEESLLLEIATASLHPPTH